jgi:hypothetical protein
MKDTPPITTDPQLLMKDTPSIKGDTSPIKTHKDFITVELQKRKINHMYKFIFHSHPDIYDCIVQHSAHITNITFTERLYMYFYQINKRPECISCRIEVNTFYGFNKGYAIFCGRACSAKNKAQQNKRKETNKKRYGTDNPNKSETVKERMRQTLMKKYGVQSLVELRWKKRKETKNDTKKK